MSLLTRGVRRGLPLRLECADGVLEKDVLQLEKNQNVKVVFWFFSLLIEWAVLDLNQ